MSSLQMMTSFILCLLYHVTGVASSSGDRPLETVDYIIIGVTCAVVTGIVVGTVVFAIKTQWYDNRKKRAVSP
jgi:hypothetical protein